MTPKALTPALLAALVAAGVALPAAAEVDPRPRMGEMFFDAADADGDGKVTAEEFRLFRAERAEGLDADGDGLISKEELTAHYERLASARIALQVDRQMARVDTDGDGMISVGELGEGLESRGAPRMFEAADADGDGAVTREEFEEFVAEHRGRFHRRGRRGG